jgi:hypothetical protein
MSKTIHQKMHDQHGKWQDDLETWRLDIQLWKKELHGAIGNLATIDHAMRDALTALGNHADALWEHQQRLHAHECIVSQEVREGSSETDREWASTHEAQSLRHEQLSDAHQRIKRYQHGVVSEVERLLGKMLEAM